MRKSIKITLMLFLTIGIGYLAMHMYKAIQQKQIAEKNITVLPAFTFTTLNNAYYTNDNLVNKNDKIIFNFFSPNCEHCQYMVTQYVKNINQLRNITIIMVTFADSSSVAKFNIDYQLNILSNIILLRDTKFQFYKTFGTATVPSFFIYTHQKLVKKIIGETKIENLIN